MHAFTGSMNFGCLWVCVQCSDGCETLILHDVRSVEFEAILDFVYDGEVRIAQEELAEFFSAAQSLGVKGLVSPGEASVKEKQKDNDDSILVKALLAKRKSEHDRESDDDDGGGGGRSID
jgi:hypothetical protein